MKLKKFACGLFTIVSVLVLLGNISVNAEAVPGVSETSIKIGGIPDMTGPAAWLGKQTMDVVPSLFKNINDHGGIHGRKLKYITEDSGFNLTRGVAAFKYLVSRHDVFALLNVIGSAMVPPLAPYIMEEKIPSIPYAQTSSVYDPFKRYIFGSKPSLADCSVIVVDYIMKDLNAKKPRLAIIHQDDDFGRDCLRGFKEGAKSYGLELVAEATHKRGAIDFTSQIINIKRADPDYIYLASYAPGLMKGADKLISRESGFPVFIGGVMLNSSKMRELAGDAAKRLLFVSDIPVEQENLPGMNSLKTITKKYCPKRVIDQHFIGPWANTLILIEGLKRAGKDLTREGLVDALETFKNFDTGGLVGSITYNSKYRKGTDSARMFRVDDELVKIALPITERRRPSIDCDKLAKR